MATIVNIILQRTEAKMHDIPPQWDVRNAGEASRLLFMQLDQTVSLYVDLILDCIVPARSFTPLNFEPLTYDERAAVRFRRNSYCFKLSRLVQIESNRNEYELRSNIILDAHYLTETCSH